MTMLRQVCDDETKLQELALDQFEQPEAGQKDLQWTPPKSGKDALKECRKLAKNNDQAVCV
eukprot:8233527-Karenia_brevis.AAC.1